MKTGRLTDFFFTGLGILPILLTVGGHLDIAMLLFFPLLIAAILSGMGDHAAEEIAANEPEHGLTDAGHDSAAQPQVVPLNTRARRRNPDA